MRICILDSYYPEAIKSMPVDPSCSYESNLAAVLGRQFGTAAFYSDNLRALGHEVIDVITNHPGLMAMRDLESQLAEFKPDVVLLQDLNIEFNYKPSIIAAQLSCPWPGDDKVRRCDVIWSSFPHYIPRIQALGVRAFYLPLAFEHTILDLFPKDLERIHDVVFIGGVGAPSHWAEGMKVLEAVAREIPTFRWWGYGSETLPKDSALHEKYQGQAFGLDMYRILLQSKICLNRHGTIALPFANNMRLFESSGMGAMLLTEDAPNMRDLFEGDEIETYESDFHAVHIIKRCLADPEVTEITGKLGQRRTLRDHTYAQRMKVVLEVLTGTLVTA